MARRSRANPATSFSKGGQVPFAGTPSPRDARWLEARWSWPGAAGPTLQRQLAKGDRSPLLEPPRLATRGGWKRTGHGPAQPDPATSVSKGGQVPLAGTPSPRDARRPAHKKRRAARGLPLLG